MRSIWPSNITIPILGISGGIGSGKTIFAASIDPANTLLFDFEKGAGSYVSLGFRIVDMAQSHLLARRQKQYEEFARQCKSIEPGTFSVIAIDPIEELELSLAEFIASNHTDYGYRSAESLKDARGIYWSFVRNALEATLLSLASKCQTLVFTTHLRKVWKGGAPTSKDEPRGKKILQQLASLHLLLEAGGPRNPPSATVLKTRIAKAFLDESGQVKIVQLLPGRLPAATPYALREYLANPPDSLKPEEIPSDEPDLSEDDKLALRAEIARNELELQRMRASQERNSADAREEVSGTKYTSFVNSVVALGAVDRVESGIRKMLAKAETEIAQEIESLEPEDRLLGLARLLKDKDFELCLNGLDLLKRQTTI